MMENSTSDLSASKALLRERIVVTALEAFTKNGIKTITMDDVANMLGISKRTLYETFKDKEELLIAGMEYKQAKMREFGERVLAESANVLEVILRFYEKSIEIYHSTNKQYFEDVNKYPRLQERMRESREHDSARTVEFFKKGVEQGLFRNDINIEVIHALLKEQMHLLAQTDFTKKFTFLEVYESLTLIYIRGISTPKGQEILDRFVANFKSKTKE